MSKVHAAVSIALGTLLAIQSFAAEPRQNDTGWVIEEIVVTGERVARSLKDTASSVAVTTPADLDVFAGPDTLERIVLQTANVTASGNGNQGPTIRGANTSGILTSLESFLGGSQPRTTVQVDGRQLTFNEFVYSGESAWDIERVEIYRGPQTTTQGRNAIAGAIFIETADPNHEQTEGRVRALLGNDQARQGSAVVSGPIGDGQFAYRFSADYRELESFVEPQGVTEDIGVDLTQIETLNVRGKLGFEPAADDAFQALLTLTHTETQRPQTDSVDRPFDDLERFNPQFSVFDTESDAAVIELEYALTSSVTVRNVTTASRVEAERLAPPGTGVADIDTDELTNELIVSLDGSDRGMTGLAGVYVSRFDADETLDLDAFGLGVGDFSDERDSLGVFAESTLALTDRTFLTLGGRYQRDSQDRDGGFGDIIVVDFDDEFDEVLPKAELAFDLTPEVRVGVLAEKGFNAGGFTFNFDTFETETFDAETLWNYEAFLRGEFLDDRLSLRANVFYSDISDLQIATLVEIAPDFFANTFSNAAEARAIGSEVSARFQASEQLQLQGSLGLVDTRIQSDTDAGADTDGNDFQRAPEFTAVAGVVYSPVPALSLSAFGRYSDGYYSDDANLAVNEVDDYVVVDLQARYRRGDFEVYLDATNVFDEFYEVAIFSDGELASPGNPRRVSLGVEYSF